MAQVGTLCQEFNEKTSLTKEEKEQKLIGACLYSPLRYKSLGQQLHSLRRVGGSESSKEKGMLEP